MLKLIFLSSFLLVIIPSAFAANVIINQVYYDPVNSESGGESVEIFNPTSELVNISGWVLKTKSSSADATIPEQTFLKPRQYFLIADAGWSVSKDNVSWPTADLEEAITLINHDGGVALLNSSGGVVDSIGWGNSSNIPLGLFEGASSQQVLSGKTLSRTGFVDTNNNYLDFSESEPQFHNSETVLLLDNEVSFGVLITNSAPVIEQTNISDDSPDAGTQIILVPGGIKHHPIRIVVSDSDGVNDIASATANLLNYSASLNMTVLNSTTALYEGYLSLPSSTPAGSWNLTLSVEDSRHQLSSGIVSVDVMSLIALSVDTSDLGMISATPGSVVSFTGDFDMGSIGDPTVSNVGNVPIDLSVMGTALISNTTSIPVGNVNFSVESDAGVFSGVLASDYQVIPSYLLPDTLASLGLKIHIPSDALPGAYSGRISVLAVQST